MHADSFHRLAKALVDSGEAASIPEAMDTFGRYGVRIRLGKELACDLGAQIIALTAINAAARSFQGNVLVDGDDVELSARGFEGQRLFQFLEWAGVSKTPPREAASWPIIAIGAATATGAIHAWSSGWTFGVGDSMKNEAVFAPACVAAGGLAVSEAFSMLRGDNPYSGRRSIVMSLWDPLQVAKKTAVFDAPPQDGIWLVGLGHLGQAYAWTLGFMRPGETRVFLQDVDSITKSSVSTSMLSTVSDVNQMKTRIVARWLETRGFKTSLVERRFDGSQRVAASEPTVALFGVDNPAARRVVENCGFRLVIDAGLGAGYRDFRAIRIRTFPGPSMAASLWAAPQSEGAIALPAAYQKLLAEGAEACGVTTLASRAVAAPFVGCVAAGYVLAERVRRQLGGAPLGFMDLNLRDPRGADIG